MRELSEGLSRVMIADGGPGGHLDPRVEPPAVTFVTNFVIKTNRCGSQPVAGESSFGLLAHYGLGRRGLFGVVTGC